MIYQGKFRNMLLWRVDWRHLPLQHSAPQQYQQAKPIATRDKGNFATPSYINFQFNMTKWEINQIKTEVHPPTSQNHSWPPASTGIQNQSNLMLLWLFSCWFWLICASSKIFFLKTQKQHSSKKSTIFLLSCRMLSTLNTLYKKFVHEDLDDGRKTIIEP